MILKKSVIHGFINLFIIITVLSCSATKNAHKNPYMPDVEHKAVTYNQINDTLPLFSINTYKEFQSFMSNNPELNDSIRKFSTVDFHHNSIVYYQFSTGGCNVTPSAKTEVGTLTRKIDFTINFKIEGKCKKLNQFSGIYKISKPDSTYLVNPKITTGDEEEKSFLDFLEG